LPLTHFQRLVDPEQIDMFIHQSIFVYMDFSQLTHFQRLLDPEQAVKRGLAKLRAQDSK
jgi:hypothetical protein